MHASSPAPCGPFRVVCSPTQPSQHAESALSPKRHPVIYKAMSLLCCIYLRYIKKIVSFVRAWSPARTPSFCTSLYTSWPHARTAQECGWCATSSDHMQAHSRYFYNKHISTIIIIQDFINTQWLILLLVSLCFDKDNSSNEQGNDDDEYESSHNEEYLVLDDPACSGRNRMQCISD